MLTRPDPQGPGQGQGPHPQGPGPGQGQGPDPQGPGQGQGPDPKDQDKDKDLTPMDQDKDKDLKYVLKESLRTRTGTRTTARQIILIAHIDCIQSTKVVCPNITLSRKTNS